MSENSIITCEVLNVDGLGVEEDSLRVEETELIELLLPSAPKEFCTSFPWGGCGWSLGGRGKLEIATLCSGANSPKLGSHWKYLEGNRRAVSHKYNKSFVHKMEHQCQT